MTGVTVAVLTIGLIAVGVGTMGFLRSSQLSSLDDRLTTIAQTDVVSALFDIHYGDDPGSLGFVPRAEAPLYDYYVAMYDAEGTRLASAGGRQSTSMPEFPKKYLPLDAAFQKQGETFTLSGTGATDFKYRVVVLPVSGTNEFYTQLVALPTAPVTQVVTAYSAIFSILALVTIIVGAMLTRWIVTLTFRSLGQVEETAMTIAAGDFSQRMTGVEPTTTEVGRLKTAINAMLGRIDGALSERDATVRQMRRFIGDASHELRTPLVTVRGYAELYRMGAIQGSTDVAQAMERIEKEAIRMGVLVEDLLALARLDERRDVAIEPVDLRPIALDAAMDVQAAAPQRTVTVIDAHDAEAPRAPATGETPTATTNSPRRRTSPLSAVSTRWSKARRRGRGDTPEDDAPASVESGETTVEVTTGRAPIVLADENRVRQVVANLLGNARRFSPEGSPIELRVGVDVESDRAWIEIIDHGEGIPEQIRQQIFQRFWRADTSRARETGGSGLGLSIVASIVETLHGEVDVVDTPGGGATFRVSLPLAEAPRDEQEPVETAPLESLPD